jgi:hypothetical protein
MAVIKKLKFGIHPKHHSRIGTFIECTSVIRQELMESKTFAFYGPTYLIEDLFEEGCRLVGLSLELQEGPMCLPFKETEQESLPWKHTSGEVSGHANTVAGITHISSDKQSGMVKNKIKHPVVLDSKPSNGQFLCLNSSSTRASTNSSIHAYLELCLIESHTLVL